LSEIVNKKKNNKNKHITQVKRKHLILMWLLLYGGRPDFGDYGEPQDVFEECITTLNFNILEPCGLSTLDPRNPFDWLVINALYYCHFANNDNDTDAVERIQVLMDILFQERDDE